MIGNNVMFNFFGILTDKLAWVLTTGWEIWSRFFALLPYGDPYIAIVAAMVISYRAFKTIYPDNQTY